MLFCYKDEQIILKTILISALFLALAEERWKKSETPYCQLINHLQTEEMESRDKGLYDI